MEQGVMSEVEWARFIGSVAVLSVAMVLVWRAVVWREARICEASDDKYRLAHYEHYFVVAERFIDESGVVRTEEMAEACANIVGTEIEPAGWWRWQETLP